MHFCFGLSMCMCSFVCVDTCTCKCMQRPEDSLKCHGLGVTRLFCETGSLTGVELTNVAIPANLVSPWDLLVYTPPLLELQGDAKTLIKCGLWGLNSGPHACMARLFMTLTAFTFQESKFLIRKFQKLLCQYTNTHRVHAPFMHYLSIRLLYLASFKSLHEQYCLLPL